jgi:hypothetical protein
MCTRHSFLRHPNKQFDVIHSSDNMSSFMAMITTLALLLETNSYVSLMCLWYQGWHLMPSIGDQVITSETWSINIRNHYIQWFLWLHGTKLWIMGCHTQNAINKIWHLPDILEQNNHSLFPINDIGQLPCLLYMTYHVISTSCICVTSRWHE